MRRKLELTVDGVKYEFLTFSTQASLDLWAKNMKLFGAVVGADGDIESVLADLGTARLDMTGEETMRLYHDMMKAADWRVSDDNTDDIKAEEPKTYDVWFSDRIHHLPTILRFLSTENWSRFFDVLAQEVAGSRATSKK